MRISVRLSICVGVLLISVVSAHAELIPLDLEHYPRVYSNAVQVDYDADGGGGGGGCTLGLLTASGWTYDLYEENADDSLPLYAGDFLLEVVIDPLTDTAVSGTLSVTGDPYGPLQNMFSSSTLKTWQPFGFGGDDLFEFQFIQDSTPGLPPEDEVLGIILSGVGIPNDIFAEGVLPTFDVDFSNTGNGYSNTFWLPEPSTAVMLGLGALGFMRRRRFRNSK